MKQLQLNVRDARAFIDQLNEAGERPYKSTHVDGMTCPGCIAIMQGMPATVFCTSSALICWCYACYFQLAQCVPTEAAAQTPHVLCCLARPPDMQASC